MQHLDEGEFYALLDKEMTPADESQARAHLAVCEICRTGLAEARGSSELLAAGLGLLDEPRQRRPFIATAAGRRDTKIAVTRERWTAAALGRAAALVLLIGAAGSATVPGWPLRDWLEGEGEQPEIAAVVRPGPMSESAPAAAASPAESGVGVEPDRGVLRITVSGARPGLPVVAVLTDSPRGGVFARGGDGAAHFDTSPGAVLVTDARVDGLRIEIPRTATEASVTINGQRYLTKDGGQLRLASDGSAAATHSFEVVP